MSAAAAGVWGRLRDYLVGEGIGSTGEEEEEEEEEGGRHLVLGRCSRRVPLVLPLWRA